MMSEELSDAVYHDSGYAVGSETSLIFLKTPRLLTVRSSNAIMFLPIGNFGKTKKGVAGSKLLFALECFFFFFSAFLHQQKSLCNGLVSRYTR